MCLPSRKHAVRAGEVRSRAFQPEQNECHLEIDGVADASFRERIAQRLEAQLRHDRVDVVVRLRALWSDCDDENSMDTRVFEFASSHAAYTYARRLLHQMVVVE